MCSIFGFIGRGKSTVRVDALASIVRGNVNRGPHSFGLAWIDDIGRMHCYKQVGRMTDHLPLLAMVRGARLLIGHLRYATHGDPTANINNHPHAADGGWIVHNGVISNYRQLLREHDLRPVSECDSEVLGLMVERSDSSSLIRRCAEAVESADGGLCMMGLWNRPATLVVARRGNPLHMSDGPDGVYLATLANGLPGRSQSLVDDSIRTFTREQGAIKTRRLDLADSDAVGGLYDEGGDYVGG